MADITADDLAMAKAMAPLSAPAATAIVARGLAFDECIKECSRISAEFHALMMKEKPASKGALRYAHLSEGALSCLINLKAKR